MARVLHTSDWHLGRQIGRRTREADFDAVLDEISEIAADFRPDLIIHSGDLFDSHRPGLDDLMRAGQSLRRLSDIAPVAVAAGNHDTKRVMWFLELMLDDLGARSRDESRIRIAADARPEGVLIAGYPCADGQSTIRLAALPYIHPNRFTYDTGDPTLDTATYAQRMRAVQADVYQRLTAARKPGDLLIYAAHLFTEGATPSYTEKPITIADEYCLPRPELPGIAYGALGHIHKPQRLPGTAYPAHYAGSPLAMDFGEAGETKSIVLVEIAEGRPASIETAPLNAGRPLVRLEGTLEELAVRAGRVGDAWVKAIVSVEAHDPFLAEKLAKMLPQATIVDIDERRPGAPSRVLDRTAGSQDLPSVEDLLRDYLAERGYSGRVVDHAMATHAELLQEPDLQDPTPCCEEQLLAAAIAGQALDAIHIDRTRLLTAADITKLIEEGGER